MPHTVEAVFREELRRAGLPGHGALPRLLALLRAAPETHLTVTEVGFMAAEAGIAVTEMELLRQLESLADHGLIGRLPTTVAETIFDTIPEPHAHLVYEDPDQIIDLHVSNETLLAMLRQALSERPEGLDILVRLRRDPPATTAPKSVAKQLATPEADQTPTWGPLDFA